MAADTSYTLGIMTTPVEERTSSDFSAVVRMATERLTTLITEQLDLAVTLFAFQGPHLTPTVGTYAPLDFLRLGVTEKLEREVQFLLMVTEVDLAATTLSYVLAFPSQITNVSIISTKRLSPAFWGEPPNVEIETRRLTTLMLHTFGHLLNVPHSDDPGNVMYDFTGVTDLDAMQTLTPAQEAVMRTNLPREARELVASGPALPFLLRSLGRNLDSMAHAVFRANPFALVTRLPTMATTGLSVVLVFFFAAETWDIASTMTAAQIAVFTLLSLFFATSVLYEAFGFGTTFTRRRVMTESTVVTAMTSALSLLLTCMVLLGAFFLFFFLASVTIFPERLMETWPTVDPATTMGDHLRLALFLASMGVLTGSLGGRADSRNVVRQVLFLDEET